MTKRFLGVVALEDVSFAAHGGEIHALLGENGAGKSTLIKILTGMLRHDAGEVLVDGKPVAFDGPYAARQHGLSSVPQDVLLVPELSIGRNLLLGFEGRLARRGTLTESERRVTGDVLARIGADYDPDTRAGSLSVPQLRLAQIARALIHTGDIVVLDEPTAALAESDADALLERLQQFREDGKAVVYVTHKLNEVMRIADTVTVLRDGCQVARFQRGEFEREQIVAAMVKEAGETRPAPKPTVRERRDGDARTLLQVRGLSSAGRFSDVSLSVGEGQLVGIAGVQGSGHGYLVRAIAGADLTDDGSVEVAGTPLARGGLAQAFGHGVLLVPADRRGAGIVANLTIRENIALTQRARAACRRFGMRFKRQERAMAEEFIQRLSIRALSGESLAGSLSGGNQQKVVIARALEGNPTVLLVEEPTQGIDVHAKREIWALIEQAARRTGCCAVIASSEFEELIDHVDVIHVMRRGCLVGSMPGSGATYREVLSKALS